MEAIEERTENLLEDLAAAYQQAGLNINVNTQTGEIAPDSTILFGVNESDISAEGKEFLKKFIQVYTSVVFRDKYENFVSTISSDEYLLWFEDMTRELKVSVSVKQDFYDATEIEEEIFVVFLQKDKVPRLCYRKSEWTK